MAKQTIPNEVRSHIVQALACFDPLQTVRESVKKDYGLDVTKQYVESHDPTKKASHGLAKRWADLFHETRKTFIEDTSGVGVSHRATRIRALQRYITKAEEQKNYRLAAELIAQVAKEMGDAYTNRRILTGKNGEALVPQSLPPVTGEAVVAAVREVGELFLGKRRE